MQVVGDRYQGRPDDRDFDVHKEEQKGHAEGSLEKQKLCSKGANLRDKKCSRNPFK